MSQDQNSNAPVPFAAFDANVNLQNDVQVPLEVVTSKDAIEGEINSQHIELQNSDAHGNIGDADAAAPASDPFSKNHGKRNKKSKKHKLIDENRHNSHESKSRNNSQKHKHMHDDEHDIDHEEDNDEDETDRYEAKSRVNYEGACAGIIAVILIVVSMIEDRMCMSDYSNEEIGDYDVHCGFNAISQSDDDTSRDSTLYSECQNDKYCQILSVVGPLWLTFSILCFLTSLFSVLLFCCALDCFKWNNKKSIMLVILTMVLEIVIIIMCLSTECTLEQYEMYSEPVTSPSIVLIMVAFVFSCIQLFFMYKVIKKSRVAP